MNKTKETKYRNQTTIILFDSVRCERYGNVWLVNDGQTRYWTTSRAIQTAGRKRYQDPDHGYDYWCQDTRALGAFGHTEIGDHQANDAFARECKSWEKRIDAAGGYDYRILVQWH